MISKLAKALTGRKQSMVNHTVLAAARLETGPVGDFLLHRRTQITIDMLVAMMSLVSAYFLRFDGWPPPTYYRGMLVVLPFVAVGRVATNYALGIYERIWRYASIPDAVRLAAAGSIVSAVLLLLRLRFVGISLAVTLPLGIILMDYLLVSLGMLSIRIIRRLTYESARRGARAEPAARQRVLLVGAGDAGVMTVKEISRRPDLGVEICGFVDDDPKKQQSIIQGVRVLGGTAHLSSLIDERQINHVIISMASAPRKTIRGVLDLCEASGVSVKIIPGLYEILSDHVTVSDIRPVEIEDLLGRDTIDLNSWFTATADTYAGKRILVTGAGGSIGRELCRQLVALNPAAIFLLDKDENSVFEVEQELKGEVTGRGVELWPIICDLRSERRLEKIFERHTPHVVFHAAAHKHVPLMEQNPCEAVLNNVLGTAKLLEACARHRTQRCVMVSTDKAVNPTSIMGATKRVAELMFQAQAARHDGACEYSCVRFGNVLGSRGSVVPSFREQIRRGGPVTVTHPDMVRYFMTIPEAAQLIIQAGSLGKRGEIFLLDMGEPVKIIDLARDMIQLSGLKPGEDIEIEFTGLRPGEKMKEELLIAEEGTHSTQYKKIFVAPPLRYDFEQLEFWLRTLANSANEGDDDAIYEIFSEMQIGFQPDASHAGKSLTVAG
jgi:FlaA1/EpsC-like NDP-sugar epimerase